MRTNLIDNRQIRVFISSTFRDMQDERGYLMKRTFPKLRKLAAERDVTLTELDLRWGITEEEAKSGKVVEICLREIENSIPFFIGIIGNRYGWVPEKKDLSTNVTERFPNVNTFIGQHLSVTEMEMQFGVLQREEDMHAYFYIKDKMEEQDNPEMLNHLKAEVEASRYPSSTYSSPENLAEQVEQAFIELLDQLFPEGTISELEKERIGQRSFMHQLCQNYIRDEKNFKELDDWMQDWDQHQMVITGASGLGKSALIANWVNEKLQDKDRGYNIIYHFTGNGGSESSHEQIMKVLIDEINDVYEWESENELNKSQEDKLNELFIRVASEGKKPLLIVLDAINQIIDTDNAKLLNWLPIPPKSIKILFSTLEDDRTMEVFRNRHYPEFVLQPLGIDSRKQLVTNYLHLYGKKLTDQQVERIATDKQCENTLVLKTLLDELINFGVYEKLDERIEYYLSQDTIEDFYQVLLHSYENEFGKEFVKHILSLVAVSRNGLSEDEISSIIKCNQIEWSQFYCSFSSHLITRNGLISYSHGYIQEAIKNRYLNNTNWEYICRTEIINKLKEDSNIRSYTELPFQYEAMDDFDSLYRLISIFDVFKFQYNNYAYDLARYWRKLIDLGYDNNVFRKILKSANTDDDTYSVIGFLNNYLSMFDLALTLLNDLEKRITKEEPNKNCSRYGDLYDAFGIIFSKLGDLNNALNYHLKAIKVLEESYGTRNTKTAMSYGNVGVIYGWLGKYTQALYYYQKALDIFLRVQGPNHPDTIKCLNNMGIVYQDKGENQKALDLLQQALLHYEQVLGKNHPDIADVYNNIGVSYSVMGDFKRALDYLQEALSIRTTVLGDNHPDTASTYNNMGSVYGGKEDYEQALKCFLKALYTQKNVWGENHFYCADCYSNISVIYKKMRNYSQAIEYGEKALAIRRQTLGENHPKVAESYSNLGNLYFVQSDYNQALDFYLKASLISEENFGNEHQETLATYYKVGITYRRLGDLQSAYNYYRKAAEKGLREAQFKIGMMYGYGQGVPQNLPEAAEWLMKAAESGHAEAQYYLSIMYANGRGVEKDESKFLEWSTKSANQGYKKAYNNLAWTYHLMGRYDEALPWAEKAVKVFPQNPGIIDTLATVYQGLGRYNEAMEQFELCLKLKKEQGATEQSIQETEAKIAELKDKMEL